jgi:hypothetical protein
MYLPATCARYETSNHDTGDDADQDKNDPMAVGGSKSTCSTAAKATLEDKFMSMISHESSSQDSSSIDDIMDEAAALSAVHSAPDAEPTMFPKPPAAALKRKRGCKHKKVEGPSSKSCAACGVDLPRTAFSGSQLQKKGNGRCRDCIASGLKNPFATPMQANAHRRALRLDAKASATDAAIASAGASRGVPADQPPQDPVGVPSENFNADAFLTRFMAFRQHVEVLLKFLPSKTARTKAWKMRIHRGSLCADVIASFSYNFTRIKLFQTTAVTFVDRFNQEEDGVDEGGLTAELYGSFFREVLVDEHGLFEGVSDGSSTSIGVLPRSSAPADALTAVGRAICKCVLDDQPLGRGLGRFVFEYLADAHEWRVFKDPHAALATRADYDPDLAQRWGQLLLRPQPGLTLDLFDDQLDGEELAPTREAFEQAIIAGCRRRLLTDREASLRALRDGFVEQHDVDLTVQLGALSSTELVRMLRGNTDLSCDDLLECFRWSGPGMQSFAAVGSDVPRYLREIILDESPSTALSSEQRLHLLEWCTALTALPCGGLKEPIVIDLFVEANGDSLPEVHTCTQEVHLPPYLNREQLQEKLLRAIEHRHDGFMIE